MKIVRTVLVLGAAMVALAATEALAEKCNGYVISKPLKPILLRKAEDGSKVQWFSSEGFVIVVSPDNHPTNRVNRVCGGGFKVGPDGKSGSGMGACSYTDLEGDVFHLTWQGIFGGGTWKVVGGTGKFDKYSAHGTYKSPKRFQNFWGSGTWEGECNFPK